MEDAGTKVQEAQMSKVGYPTEVPVGRGVKLHERPIELIYSNEHPYALAEVRIWGHTLNPRNYIIDAKEGTVTLIYPYHKCALRLREEDEV